MQVVSGLNKNTPSFYSKVLNLVLLGILEGQLTKQPIC
jgi:hypothetical protein